MAAESPWDAMSSAARRRTLNQMTKMLIWIGSAPGHGLLLLLSSIESTRLVPLFLAFGNPTGTGKGLT